MQFLKLRVMFIGAVALIMTIASLAQIRPEEATTIATGTAYQNAYMNKVSANVTGYNNGIANKSAGLGKVEENLRNNRGYREDEGATVDTFTNLNNTGQRYVPIGLTAPNQEVNTVTGSNHAKGSAAVGSDNSAAEMQTIRGTHQNAVQTTLGF